MNCSSRDFSEIFSNVSRQSDLHRYVLNAAWNHISYNHWNILCMNVSEWTEMKNFLIRTAECKPDDIIRCLLDWASSLNDKGFSVAAAYRSLSSENSSVATRIFIRDYEMLADIIASVFEKDVSLDYETNYHWAVSFITLRWMGFDTDECLSLKSEQIKVEGNRVTIVNGNHAEEIQNSNAVKWIAYTLSRSESADSLFIAISSELNRKYLSNLFISIQKYEKFMLNQDSIFKCGRFSKGWENLKRSQSRAVPHDRNEMLRLWEYPKPKMSPNTYKIWERVFRSWLTTYNYDIEE